MQHVSPAPPTECPLADVKRLVTALVLADEDRHGAAQQDKEAEEREKRSSPYVCQQPSDNLPPQADRIDSLMSQGDFNYPQVVTEFTMNVTTEPHID